VLATGVGELMPVRDTDFSEALARCVLASFLRSCMRCLAAPWVEPAWNLYLSCCTCSCAHSRVHTLPLQGAVPSVQGAGVRIAAGHQGKVSDCSVLVSVRSFATSLIVIARSAVQVPLPLYRTSQRSPSVPCRAVWVDSVHSRRALPAVGPGPRTPRAAWPRCRTAFCTS
jgi:hypothetical protein